MIRELRASGRMEITVLLSAMALLCFSMSLTRYFITHSRLFLFLNWNLFLAFLPWVASSVVMLKPGLTRNRIVLMALLGAWILFFPNSPYILTDLFHLQNGLGAPLWFDLDLLFDVGDRLVNPFSHSRTWGVTLTMGILLNMMYWTIKAIRKGNTLQGAPQRAS